MDPGRKRKNWKIKRCWRILNFENVSQLKIIYIMITNNNNTNNNNNSYGITWQEQWRIELPDEWLKIG